MRLLKYPLEGYEGNASSIISIGDELLVLCGRKGSVKVWEQKLLLDTAFDKCALDTLKTKYVFNFEFENPEEELVFGMGDEQCLYLATEQRVYCYENWLKSLKGGATELKRQRIFQCQKGSIITDVKWDAKLKLLFVLADQPCRVYVFNLESPDKKKLCDIRLEKNIKPLTGIVDPSGAGTFTVLTSDKSIIVYHLNKEGKYKTVEKLLHHVLVYPLNYRITMPPQADYLPVINSLKGSTGTAGSTVTALFNRNLKYKVMATVIEPASTNTKVLVHSPKIYEKVNTKKGTRTRYNLLATSTNVDGTVLVWNSRRQKPLFNGIHISDSPITDMTWSSNGLTLFGISNDNVLYTFAFLESDLGNILPDQEIEEAWKSNKITNVLKVTKSSQSQKKPVSQEPSQPKSEANIVSTSNPVSENKQKTPETAESTTVTDQDHENTTKSETKTSDSIADDNKNNSKKKPSNNSSNKNTDAAKNGQNGNNSAKDGKVKTTEGVVNENSKTKIVDSNSDYKIDSTGQKSAAQNTDKNYPTTTVKIEVDSKQQPEKSGTQVSQDFKNPSYAVPKDLKRKPREDSVGNGSAKKQKKELEPLDFLDTNLILPNVAFSRIRLATPLIRMNFNYSPPTDEKLVINVRNGSGNEQKPTIIKLSDKSLGSEQSLFQDFIPKYITLVASGDSFWACSSDDGTLYIYNDSGRKIIPSLTIGVPISFLEACGSYLLCVSSIGELYCWDIKKGELAFPSNSVFPLLNPSLRYADDVLTRAENITMCSVTNDGFPLATLSNGDGYMFDRNMQCWLLISDGWWAYGSQYWDSTNSSTFIPDQQPKNINSTTTEQPNFLQSQGSIVSFMEKKTNNELTRKGRIKNLRRFARTILMKEGFENIEEVVTLSHLENRLLVTLRLHEDLEFKKFITLYAVKLGELGYIDRLEDLFAWLYNNGDLDQKLIKSISRTDLLKHLITACAKIRNIQRITNSYAEILGLLPNNIFFDKSTITEAENEVKI
ncbi:Protein HIR2 [Nakaseomyces bracarensis]|uniref:Protein HIR n=1 Tax=Nakaseomyces bracarensis TaxID=273131 RepID=A0ABR4NPL1_9SACH